MGKINSKNNKKIQKTISTQAKVSLCIFDPLPIVYFKNIVLLNKTTI